MEKAFVVKELNELVFCKSEAVQIAEGTPILEGTFRPTLGTWSGIFETDDGQAFEIVDGYIKEVMTG